jgi:hypothetical protein
MLGLKLARIPSSVLIGEMLELRVDINSIYLYVFNCYVNSDTATYRPIYVVYINNNYM